MIITDYALLRPSDRILLRGTDKLVLRSVTVRDDTRFTQLQANATAGKIRTFSAKGDVGQDNLLLLGVS